MTIHYSYGPSSMHRNRRCPGSVKMSAELEPLLEPQSDDYAKFGTDAHGILETCVKDDLSPGPLTDDANTVEGVQRVLELIQEIRRDYDVVGEHLEETIVSDKFTDDHGRPEFGGTPDWWCLYLNEDMDWCVYIIDYKSGWQPHEADADQFRAYGLLILEKFPQVKHVTITVIQPMSDPMERTATIDAGEVLEYENVIHEIRKQSHLESGDWCTYCPCRHSCSVLDESTELASDKSLVLGKGFRVRESTEGVLAHWEHLMERRTIINKLMDELPKMMMAAMKQGHKFENYKAVEGMGSRQWIHDDETTTKKLAGRKLGKTITHKSVLKSPPALIKEGYEEEVEGLYHRPSTGPKLVKRSAKGKEITFSTADDEFDVIEQGQ